MILYAEPDENAMKKRAEHFGKVCYTESQTFTGLKSQNRENSEKETK